MRIFKRNWMVKGKKPGQKVARESKNWYGEYRNSCGKLKRVKLCPDKAAAERMLAKLSSEAAMESLGISNPYRNQEKRTISEHLSDFKKHLRAKGDTSKHIKHTLGMCQRTFSNIDTEYLKDLSPSRIENYLMELRGCSLSINTTNHYVRAVKSFSTWLFREGRTSKNYLISLSLQNHRTDRRRWRRNLTASEKAKLIKAAENGETYKGLTGEHRALCYKLALTTGLRANEIRSLEWSSFNIEQLNPTVTVTAAYSKRRRQDTLPLKRSVADELLRFRDKCTSTEKVFPFPEKTAEMLRFDLEAAGIAYVVKKAGENYTADFHALRYTFITDLVNAGVPPKVVQTLARHSDIGLTMNIYAQVEDSQKRDAVEMLPDFISDVAGPKRPENFVPDFVRNLTPIPAIDSNRQHIRKIGS